MLLVSTALIEPCAPFSSPLVFEVPHWYLISIVIKPKEKPVPWSELTGQPRQLVSMYREPRADLIDQRFWVVDITTCGNGDVAVRRACEGVSCACQQVHDAVGRDNGVRVVRQLTFLRRELDGESILDVCDAQGKLAKGDFRAVCGPLRR